MIKHIIFKVIGKCNLNCPHCYYMTNLDSKWDGHFPVKKLPEFFLKLSNYTKNIRVSWHGGEPLLVGIEFFQSAIEAAQNAGVELHNSIQTNGLLLDHNWCYFFKKNDFHVGVSIDGPADIHNVVRPKKSQNAPSSYQGAVSAITLLQKHRVKFGTLTVIHPYADGQCVFHHLKSLGVRSMDFLLPITDREVKHECLEGCAKYLLDVFNAWIMEEDDSIKIRYFENIIKSIIGGSAKQCILSNSCTSYITIEPNGDVGMCENIRTVDQGFYETGMNIFEAEYIGIEKKINEVLERSGFNSLSQTCSKCEYLKACQGGCPVARHDGLLGFRRPSVYCDLYKTIIYNIYEFVRAQRSNHHNDVMIR